jgi:hypothetical protein
MTLWYWGGKLQEHFRDGLATLIAGLIISVERMTARGKKGTFLC